MAIKVIGLDLAKNVFQVHGIDEAGRVMLKRKLRRTEVLRLRGARRCPADCNAAAGGERDPPPRACARVKPREMRVSPKARHGRTRRDASRP